MLSSLAGLSPAAIAAIKSGVAASSDRRSNSIPRLAIALLRRGLESHENALGSRGITDLCDAVQRHQHIGFGIVGGRRAACGRIRDHSEILGAPLDTVVPGTYQVDELAVGQAQLLDVCGVD